MSTNLRWNRWVSGVMWHPHADQSSPRLFLGQRAPTSVQPEPHLFAGSSSPDTRCVPVQPGDWAGSSAAKQRPRFRRSPFASGRTSSDAAHALRIGPKSEFSPGNGASTWRPFLLRCSSCVAFSRGLSVILTEERSLHFQLRRNKGIVGWPQARRGNGQDSCEYLALILCENLNDVAIRLTVS